MPDGYDVLTDELTSHAQRLDGLGERLETALQAATQTYLGTDAYGVICQFFVPMVNAVSAPGVTAIGQATESVGDAAAGMRETATSYDNTESANTRPFADGAR